MIPKIFHYIWLGESELPDYAQRFIAGWRLLHPEWRIKNWGNQILSTVSCPYVREAASAGKWAFVSDYLRLWVLSREGGVYLDTDVELKRSLNSFLSHRIFFGLNKSGWPQTAVIGAEPHNFYIDELLHSYDQRRFDRGNGIYDELPINVGFAKEFAFHGVELGKASQVDVTEILPGVAVYPSDILCRPGSDSALNVAHHHAEGTWLDPYKRKWIFNLPFGFRVVWLKRRKFAMKSDPLNLLACERIISFLHIRRFCLVLVSMAIGKEGT